MEETYFAFNSWWEDKEFDSGIIRDDYVDRTDTILGRKQIEMFVGSRRAGKTTFLKQIIQRQIDKGIDKNTIFYLALDHPKLSDIPISEHIKKFRKIFMHKRTKKVFLFLDEVQESPHWEIELKSIYDLEDIKIICTGSTSALLMSQGGKLTGRQIVTTLFPLSFREFLSFKKSNVSRAEDYKYETLVQEYLQSGGYPENVLHPSEEYLYNLVDDIIARDLVRLYQIRKASVLKDILRLLASSAGSRTSFNKLANIVGLNIDTVKEYIKYFESAFLVKLLEKWSTSYTEKVYAYKKIYLMDNGIKTIFTGKGDLGAKAESTVFLKLLKQNVECGYYAESGKEVDFILGNVKNPLPIEVKYDSKIDWSDKRFSGVRLFLKKYPQTKRVIIVTKDVNDRLIENERTIEFIPLWKFLLYGF